MELSIITVTWNNEENIAEQISSVVSGCKDITCEEIVVDNGSSDNTIDIINKMQETHNYASVLQIIENGKNLGFGAANNKGVEIAKGEFILFLNPDMRVKEGSLDKMVAWMRRHKDVGIASPKLVDQQGKFNWDASPRRFPRLWEQIALIFKLPHLFPKMLDKYHMKDFDIDREQEVDSVRGSFMIMRREVVEKLGWAFDPRYFIWYEDVDTCRECWQAGFKVMYTPVITCVDYVGQSFKKRKGYWKQKNFTGSMLTYFKKWEPMYKWIWIALFRPVGLGLAKLNDLVNK